MKQFLGLFGACLLFLTLFAACGGGGNAAPAGSIPVHVTETDFHIASSVTTFSPGKTYDFEVTNQSQDTHEFMIMPGSADGMNGKSMGSMDKMALASIAMINPGQTATLKYTIPASAAGSHIEFACYFPGHYEAGMKLPVTVQA